MRSSLGNIWNLFPLLTSYSTIQRRRRRRVFESNRLETRESCRTLVDDTSDIEILVEQFEWYFLEERTFLNFYKIGRVMVHDLFKKYGFHDVELNSKGLSLFRSSFFFRGIVFLVFRFSRLDSLTGINSRGINSISRVGRRSRRREFVRWLG